MRTSLDFCVFPLGDAEAGKREAVCVKALEEFFGGAILARLESSTHRVTVVGAKAAATQVARGEDGSWLVYAGSPVLPGDEAGPAEPGAEMLRGILREGAEYADRLDPPFALCAYDASKRALLLAIDHCGLQHVYSYVKEPGASYCTSAVALARAHRCRLSLDGIADVANVGHMLGDCTLFDGVAAMPRGAALLWESDAGKARRVEPQPAAAAGLFESTHEAVRAGAEILRREVRRRWRADAILELSGGLDSRVLLAAALAEGLPVRAFTLGAQGTPDVAVASDLARKMKIEHQVLPLKTEAAVRGRPLAEDALGFSRAQDHAAQVTSYALWPQLFRDLDSLRARQISGQGGEAARGQDYFVTDPVEYDDTRIRCLFEWRLSPNAVVAARLFKNNLGGDLRERCFSHVSAGFPRALATWRRALDGFHLEQTTCRATGRCYSACSRYYRVASPYLSREFLGWAGRLPDHGKYNSEIMKGVLKVLSPGLYRLRLADGRSALVAEDRSVLESARERVNWAVRAGRKVLQRYLGVSRKGAVGATEVCDALCGEIEVQDGRALRTEGLFDMDALNKFLRAPARHWREIGLVLALEWAARDAGASI
jgi:hypothetical protein